MNSKKKNLFVSVVLFGLPIFVLGFLASLVSIYYLNHYERMWGRGISLQVTIWFINIYTISGILLFWLGAAIKHAKIKEASMNALKSLIYGIIHTVILLLSAQLNIAVFALFFFILPVLLGMEACQYRQDNHCIDARA